jgi:integrase
MAKRRRNQEGSIIKRENGSYRAQISIQGKRLSHTARSVKECLAWIQKAKQDYESELEHPGADQTFEKYLENWLITKQPSLRRTTHYQYTLSCKRYITPFLGKYRLNEIRPEHIQKLYATHIKAGLGARTIRIIHGVLHQAFQQAVKLWILDRNPVTATTPPKVQSEEMHFYDEEQVGRFLFAAKGEPNEALYHLAVATGLRQSELLGLKWTDLDYERRTLTVQRQLQRNGPKDNLFAQPKTSNGRRTIVLGKATMAKLQEHWWKQNKDRIEAGDRWKEHELMFPTPTGTPKNHANLYRQFKAIISRAGLPEIRFHDLRHTAASLLLNHGIPAIIVSRRLGHYKVSMTLDIYGHLMPEMQEDAAKLIDELITPIEVKLRPNCAMIDPSENQGALLPPYIEKDPQK